VGNVENVNVQAILDSLRSAKAALAADKGDKYSIVRANLVGQIKAYKEVLRMLKYEGPEVE
jgi:hypothetical protein